MAARASSVAEIHAGIMHVDGTQQTAQIHKQHRESDSHTDTRRRMLEGMSGKQRKMLARRSINNICTIVACHGNVINTF